MLPGTSCATTLGSAWGSMEPLLVGWFTGISSMLLTVLCHPGGPALPGQQPETFLHATTSAKSSGNANQGWTQKPLPPTCCPEDVKLIRSHFCLVTGQANIPEVWWALRTLCLLQCFYSIFSHLLTFAPAEGFMHSCFLCKCCWCFGTIEVF